MKKIANRTHSGHYRNTISSRQRNRSGGYLGTEEQKQKYLKPMLEGDLVAAEALTEPRGGSDFFGATSQARDMGDHFLVRGSKRFIVGAEGADFFLTYVRTNLDGNASPYERISTMLIDRSPSVEVKYLYGLLGTRGGGTGRVVFRDLKVPKSNLVGMHADDSEKIFDDDDMWRSYDENK